MYVVIVGAGEVGSYVARMLVEQGHDVAVIETREELARRFDATLNALVVHGSGAHPGVLKRAGIEHADLLLALTGVDEVNLIASMTARKHGRAELRAVARIRQSPDLAGETLSAEDLGLDALISPEQSLATAAMDAIRYTGSGEMRELAGGRLVLIGMDLGPDSPLVHGTLAQVRHDFGGDFLVVAALGREGIRILGDDEQLAPYDRAYVLTLPQNLTELAILSGQPWHQAQHILIIGCGNTGLLLAHELESQQLDPMIVEQDRDRAERVSGLLSRSLVLHADGSDPELLRARIEEDRIDTVVVTIAEPEKSVLIGIFATFLGAPKVIARCDEAGYTTLANQLGIDAVISPKRAMADAILRYGRSGAVESTLLLGEHEAEVLLLRVPDRPANADLLDRPLKDLPLPKGTLVGAVIRGGTVVIGPDDTVLQAGDEVVMVSPVEALGKLEGLFC